MRVQTIYRVAYIDKAGRTRSKVYTRRNSAVDWHRRLIELGKAGVELIEGVAVWPDGQVADPTPRDETAPERSGGTDDRWPGMLEELRVQGRMPFAPIREWMDETRDDPSVHGDGPRWDAWYELYDRDLVDTDPASVPLGEDRIVARAHTQRLDGGR